MPLRLPAPDHTPLTASPLVQVIGQLRFEEHAEVSGSQLARSFHDALGGGTGDYPTVQNLVGGQTVTLSISPSGQPVANTKPSEGWRFSSKDSAGWAVALFPDSVGLETTAYTTWEDFSARMSAVLDVAVSVVNPAFEQRLAIRFIDRVRNMGIDTPAGWEPYISPYLLGAILHPGIGSAVRGAQQILQIDLGNQEFCGMRHFTIPAENDPALFDYMLDFDIFREGGRPLDIENVKETLDRFNDYGEQLFQAAVTPALMDRLR
jgi:uncharacterized protein (TIGR04255 family)